MMISSDGRFLCAVRRGKWGLIGIGAVGGGGNFVLTVGNIVDFVDVILMLEKEPFLVKDRKCSPADQLLTRRG